jgi:segregation and condensation protein A
MNGPAIDKSLAGFEEEKGPAVGKPPAGFEEGSSPAEFGGGSMTLDLDVFEGPFDLLITLVLNKDVDLLEVDLADVVLAYIERLEARGELDLEAATEFLVLIAALLELKSRLMLPSEEIEGLELEPQEAVEELLARLLEYRRYRAAGGALHELLASEHGYRYRSAPLPPELRRVALESAAKAYEPALLAEAIRGLLRTPPAVDTAHLHHVTVSLERRLAHVRALLESRRSFSFEEVVAGEDRMTQAVTLFALLELYKLGELTWSQSEPFGPIEIEAVQGA